MASVMTAYNRVNGAWADQSAHLLRDILRGEGKQGRVPEYWDGHAADRIASDLWQWLRAGAA